MRLRPAALGTRLTLLLATVASSALAVLGGVTLWSLDEHFIAQDRGILHSQLQQARLLIAQVDDDVALAALPARLRTAFAAQSGLAVRVQLAGQPPLFEQHAASLAGATLVPQSDVHPAPLEYWHADGSAWRGSALLMPLPLADSPPLAVSMALDIDHHEIFIARFRHALIGYVLLTALGCALLAWWAVRRGLQPLQAMRAQATRIGAGELDARMPVTAAPAELAELASSLNAMLAQLQGAFERLAAFSSDIAHELRTPLSNLLMQTQVALSQPRSSATYRDVLASNAEEIERLGRTVADMLLLAKAEHGHLLPSRAPVALAAEVHALFEFHEALAEDRGVLLHLHGAATVDGDRLMLRRALGNLLSNALRHTPRGGSIEVRITQAGHEVRLAVHNTGAPIPAERLPHLFARFYRAEADRSRQAGDGDGTGLGLAITRAIVEAHGGRIGASSAVDGNTFTLRLPASRTDDGNVIGTSG